jgi:hypothetical protein
MPVEYLCATDCEISATQWEGLLIKKMGFEARDEPWGIPDKNVHYLVNPNQLFILLDDINSQSQIMRLATEAMGFVPSVLFTLRAPMGGKFCVPASIDQVSVADFLLTQSKGNFGFSSELERLLIQRLDGTLYVRDNYEKWKRPQDLSLITLPYQLKALTP